MERLPENPNGIPRHEELGRKGKSEIRERVDYIRQGKRRSGAVVRLVVDMERQCPERDVPTPTPSDDP